MRDFEPSFRNIKECHLNYKILSRLQSKKTWKTQLYFSAINATLYMRKEYHTISCRRLTKTWYKFMKIALPYFSLNLEKGIQFTC